jgi:hypothetical protein
LGNSTSNWISRTEWWPVSEEGQPSLREKCEWTAKGRSDDLYCRPREANSPRIECFQPNARSHYSHRYPGSKRLSDSGLSCIRSLRVIITLKRSERSYLIASAQKDEFSLVSPNWWKAKVPKHSLCEGNIARTASWWWYFR